jgi:hypothetical protein
MGLAMGLDRASELITESNWRVISSVEDEEGDVSRADGDTTRVGSGVDGGRGIDRESTSNIADSLVRARAC